MATEVLYASSLLSGAITNPGNALGSGAATWAGDLNTNASVTTRWAIVDPVEPLTPSITTHQILVRARKGSNSGTPTIQINLYENGVLISAGAVQNVISTVGQDLTRTFTSAQITNPANLEVEVVMAAAGGSPSARNSAQIDYIRVTVDTTALQRASGGSSIAVTVTASAAGAKNVRSGSSVNTSITSAGQGSKAASGGSLTAASAAPTGDGLKMGAGGSSATVQLVTLGGGEADNGEESGGSSSVIGVTPSGAGAKAVSGGSSVSVAVSAQSSGAKNGLGSTSTASATIAPAGSGSKASESGSLTTAIIQAEGAGEADNGPDIDLVLSFNPPIIRSLTFTLRLGGFTMEPPVVSALVVHPPIKGSLSFEMVTQKWTMIQATDRGRWVVHEGVLRELMGDPVLDRS